MKTIAIFLVKWRYFILAVILSFTVFSVMMIKNVNIITDMTKFLADDSSMKTGVNIMEEKFPETSVENTISIMFTAPR